MSVRMRTWLAKAKGIGNGDNNPLLNEEEKKQPINNDDENPWGTLNPDDTKYDTNNINDIQQQPPSPLPPAAKNNKKRGSKSSRKQQQDGTNDSYQQLESDFRPSPNNNNYPQRTFASPHATNPSSNNVNNLPYLVPPARESALVALKAFPSPFKNPKEQDKTKFYIHLNEDLFLYSLSFLNNRDLTVISVVCRKWKQCAYQPILWRRLDLSKYSDGAHDYLLKHILINDICHRFNHVLQINLENCSALTDQALIFITQKCPYLRILSVTNCYRLSPKTIYFTVQKLQYLHKLELYGVISTHNKYYHIQQLQQLTYFLNELGIQSGNIAPPPPPQQQQQQQAQQAVNGANNNDGNNNVDDPAMRNAQNVANQGDDANAAANPAAPANNAQNEANIIDNQPSLNNRIQRVRLMICLAKAIKNCRPWMDLGLFWMQILSMVGRNDPLMILNVAEYHQLYATQNEMSNLQYVAQCNDNLDSMIFKKEEFHGARYMTLNEYKLYLIRCEMEIELESEQKRDDESSDESSAEEEEKEAAVQDGAVYVGIASTTSATSTSSEQTTPNKSKKNKKSRNILDGIDMDFELCPDHEWMRSTSSMKRRKKKSMEMDTFSSNVTSDNEEAEVVLSDDDDDDDGFYPKHYPINIDNYDCKNAAADSTLFAFNKLRVEKLRNYFVSEYDKTLPPNLTVAECRYRGRFQGGCWGRVIGRIVYSNCDYQQHGNYPCEVLFSCEAHSNEDFTDDLLDKCQSCERLFRKKSMLNVNNLICKTCFDSKKLQEKCIWVNLNKKGLKSFNFAHVVQYTLNVADRRNLPKTLKSYGKIKAELTYEVGGNEDVAEEEEEEEKLAIDYSRISVHQFWEHNQVRISGMMDKFKETLKKAQGRKATRAILVYHDPSSAERQNGDVNNVENAIAHERKENDVDDVEIDDGDDDERAAGSKYIEVLADPGVLFDGLDGVDYIFLTVSAWTQFYSILCPILLSILCTLYFLYELDIYNYNATNNAASASPDSQNAIHLPDAPTDEESSSMYLFYALGAFLILITGAFIAYRFQRKCEQVFRLFLVLDIFLILSIGFAILFIIVGINYNFSLDEISFWICVYNFGVIGVMTFYCAVPPLLHRIFLVLLNCIMSIMITSAISWYVLFLLLILICADIIAMIKPSFGRMFSPFLVPTQIQLPNTTPRIFYQVYGLRVRAPEFMFYGLMLGLIEQSTDDSNKYNGYYTQVILLLITVISGFVISVFVMPFFSKQIRPLPVSFTLLIIAICFYQQIFKSYHHSNVWTLVVP